MTKEVLKPAQEPVAWMYQEYRDDDHFGWRDEIQFVQPPNHPVFRNVVALSPLRPWVGLTDKEFQLIYDMGRTPTGMMEMVEAKLKELNNG